MKLPFKKMAAAMSVLLIATAILFYINEKKYDCLTGAYLGAKPSSKEIIDFKNQYGKSPFLVAIFIDWDSFVDEKTVHDVYAQGSELFITWEPWHSQTREGINYDELLSGKYDPYISAFASRIKKIEKRVFIRFAHEMNSNWYPWSGVKIGKDKYIAVYRHVRDIFAEDSAVHARWVFSVNWEDVPKENNDFMTYYPGDAYVDYAGIDGYNWGHARSWSRWMSFRDIFAERYKEMTGRLKKPVLITEFSSTAEGGDKRIWIKEALQEIKRMKNIKGFILFNIDKEMDWSFPEHSDSATGLKSSLNDPYFK